MSEGTIGSLTNVMSYARASARSNRAVALLVRILDKIRRTDLEHEALLADAARLRVHIARHPVLARGEGVRVDATGTWIVVNGCLFALESASWHLLVRSFEEREFAELAARVREGSVVLDVGANFGFYAVALAARSPGATVHAFEPASASLALLRRNVERNGTANVRVHPVAVSSRAGHVAVTTEFTTGNYVVRAGTRMPPRVETVRAVTLDEFWAEAGRPRVDVMKIDVEGGEWDALVGGRGMLRELRPFVQIEIVAEWLLRSGRTPEDCRRELTDIGYTSGRAVTDDTWQPIDALSVERPGNYFFQAD